MKTMSIRPVTRPGRAAGDATGPMQLRMRVRAPLPSVATCDDRLWLSVRRTAEDTVRRNWADDIVVEADNIPEHSEWAHSLHPPQCMARIMMHRDASLHYDPAGPGLE